jgi:Lrp/AsnC family leucine-responsive transcriptional regulator
MDQLDKRILAELTRDADQTIVQIAARVCSTVPTVHRRIRRLKRDGVIERTVAIVHLPEAGRAITVVVGVVVKSQKPRDQSEFRKFIRRNENIRLAWMTTGEFDYVLVAAFPDTDSYYRFVDRELIKSVNFSNFRTFVSLGEIKFDTAPLIR